MTEQKGWTREQMAARAAAELTDGSYVNLGIGLPTLVADFLPKGREIILHSENGILGLGPKPAPDQIDEDLINAGKEPATLLTGGSYFHHADSFGMIRGRHLDYAILGAFQVSTAGDLAKHLVVMRERGLSDREAIRRLIEIATVLSTGEAQ